jgi:GAF domain-containing protein
MTSSTKPSTAIRADAPRELLLKRLVGALASILGRDEVLRAMVDTTVDVLGARSGSVLLMSEGGREMRLAYSLHSSATFQEHWRVAPIRPDPLIERVARREAVFLSSHDELVALSPRVAETLSRGGARVILPLSSGEQFLGLLLLTFHEEREFDDEQQELYLAVAAQCSIALGGPFSSSASAMPGRQRSGIRDAGRRARSDDRHALRL